jgi:hypothetical protein
VAGSEAILALALKISKSRISSWALRAFEALTDSCRDSAGEPDGPAFASDSPIDCCIDILAEPDGTADSSHIVGSSCFCTAIELDDFPPPFGPIERGGGSFAVALDGPPLPCTSFWGENVVTLDAAALSLDPRSRDDAVIFALSAIDLPDEPAVSGDSVFRLGGTVPALEALGGAACWLNCIGCDSDPVLILDSAGNRACPTLAVSSFCSSAGGRDPLL